jgi:hypothetical protein
LIFGTGKFRGVYFSEEFKYARSIGYNVIPLRGYLFYKGEGLFDNFVNELFNKRMIAKTEGNKGLSDLYKILMNSLYGRFGIKPDSTVTTILDEDQLKLFTEEQKREYEQYTALGNDYFILEYQSNTFESGSHWNPPRKAAVQLSAAVTASALIYMHRFLNREDCFYTDTDSVVLSNPLPSEVINKEVLGLLKLEYVVKKGYFLAPKCYSNRPEGKPDVVVHKGLAKNFVNFEWFESVYKDPSRTRGR